MTGNDMADFMGQNTGQFCLVRGKGSKTTRDIDITTGQGKGVDNRGIQNGESEFLVRSFRNSNKLLAVSMNGSSRAT